MRVPHRSPSISANSDKSSHLADTHGITPIVDIEQLVHALHEARGGFQRQRVSREEAAPDWSIRDGFLQHRTGGFFAVAGLKDLSDGSERVMLYQPQGAINGLLRSKSNGAPVWLLQARAEPGNVGDAQFGPSLQSTPANYLRAHGGAASPYFAAVLLQNEDVTPASETTQLDLGNRYFRKTKRVVFLDIANPPEPPVGFHWISSGPLVEATRASFTLNTDMRAALSVHSWTPNDEAGLRPKSAAIRASLAAPVRNAVLGGVLKRLAAIPPSEHVFRPLGSLSNWVTGPDGIEERARVQGFSIEFHRTRARNREVGSWTQPLIRASSEGLCAMLTRERGGFVECLVRVAAMPGLATGGGVLPSHLVSPGMHDDLPDWMGPHIEDTWGETRESDEGGRFLHHTSRFIIARVGDGPVRAPDDGYWLRISELKALLGMSNVCTIELRVLTSLLLGLE